MLNLCLHAGGHKVEREQLDAVVTPQASATWQPIPHHTLLNRVDASRVAIVVAVALKRHRNEMARGYALLDDHFVKCG